MSTEDEMRALEEDDDEGEPFPIVHATPGSHYVRVPCGLCPSLGLTESVNFHIVEARQHDPQAVSILHGNVVRVVLSLN